MLNKVLGVIVGMLIVVGALGYFVYDATKKPENVTTTIVMEPVPAIFSGGGADVTSMTNGLVKHGDLPVKVNSDEMGRDDPFVKY